MLEEILNDRFVRRILADEVLVSPELIVAIVLRLPLERGRNGEQLRVGSLRGGVLLNRLEVVEHPERAAVRRDEHRVVARMKRDLVDANVGEIRLEPLPARAAIDRQKHSGLGAEVEHVAIALIFGERACRFAGEIVDDRVERRAEVGAHPDVRRVVVEPMVVDGDVHRARVVRRRNHSADPTASRKAGKILRDVLPRLAAVARHVQQAVVAARVVHPGLLRRLGERDERWILRDAVVARDANLRAFERPS